MIWFTLITFLLIQKSSIEALYLNDKSIAKQNRVLLYKVNDDQSIYIIDKLNKLSFINNKNEFNIKTIDFDVNNNKHEIQQLDLLYAENDYMLVGSINKVYNISLNDLENRKIESDWSTNLDLVKHRTVLDCDRKRNPYECNNYIKTAIPFKDKNLLLTCGTNMNKPFCRKQIEHKFESNFLLPQFLQLPKSFHIRTQNIPAFDYSQSIYFFHSQLPSQDIYKQNYVISNTNNDIQFTELIKTPLGVIKSKKEK